MSPRGPLTFRIRVEGSRFIRVNVYDTRPQMLKEMAARSGMPHRDELAVTLTGGLEPAGCVADVYFYWRGLRPSVIAHEAMHAAWAVAITLGKGVGPDSEEFVAGWVDRIVERIWLKVQAAPL